MIALEVWGQPAYLVVPSDRHRMDAKVWKTRYPAIQVVTPPGARGHESALMVSAADDGCTLILNDVVGNIRDSKGFGGWRLRWTSFR